MVVVMCVNVLSCCSVLEQSFGVTSYNLNVFAPTVVNIVKSCLVLP